jgi:hypothetical protein
MYLADKILAELRRRDGLSDRQLAEAIFGTRHCSIQINGECRYLEKFGLISRIKEEARPIRNLLIRPQPRLMHV